jgi:hypothetical protein
LLAARVLHISRAATCAANITLKPNLNDNMYKLGYAVIIILSAFVKATNEICNQYIAQQKLMRPFRRWKEIK